MDNQETVEPPPTSEDVKKRNRPYRKREKKKVKNTPEDLLAKQIKNLPVPSQQQLNSLTELLNVLHEKYGLTKQNILDREEIVRTLSESVDKELPGLSFRLFGSSISLLGFKTSDVNISVYKVGEDGFDPRIFIELLTFLRNSDYLNVEEDFQSKYPEINFIHSASGLTCRITSDDEPKFLTSNLLRVYGELDNRVKPLCIAFRSWAKICHVDLPLCKTLPPYSFCLMVVHYLQQTDPPILPVIHDLLEDAKIVEYLENDMQEELVTKVRGMWDPTNNECLGGLWLKLLKFYINSDYFEHFVVSLRQKEKPTSSKAWGKRSFAMEDPFIPKTNVARPMVSPSYHYMVKHLKVALLYFGNFLPHGRYQENSPKIGNVNVDEFEKGRVEGKNLDTEITTPIHVIAKHTEVDDDDDNDDIINNDIDNEEDANDDIISDHDYEDAPNIDSDKDGDLVDGIFAMDNINDSPLESVKQTTSQRNATEATRTEKTTVVADKGDICVDGLLYSFDSSVLRKGQPIEHKCSICNQFGHVALNCKDEKTVELSGLPELPPWFKQILDIVCLGCFEDFGLTKTNIERRRQSVQTLQSYIQQQSPGAQLHLFGSSCNGFGFNDSDLDICLMFENKTSEEIDCIAVIKSLRRLLAINLNCREVFAITGAKVPIVKFYYAPCNLEADISLYNEFALHNTRLLATYVEIDKRVQILGYVLKTFVKLCDIGDASRGSLSSYAYILMLLHFLQQRKPPVIPFLQEMNYSDEKPVKMIKGWDCWFQSDLNKLDWNTQNHESYGELWLGFLRYYTEKFDFHRNVVSARTSTPLAKFEKKWIGKKICIEDPFVLTHNLGAGVTQQMATFILNTFRKGRDHFGTPSTNIPENPSARQRFFFNSLVLNNGKLPPTGNNCHLCGKIGHRKHECQLKTATREGRKTKVLSNKGKKDQRAEVKQKQRNDKKVAGHVVDGVKQGKRVAGDVTTANRNIIANKTDVPTRHVENASTTVDQSSTKSHNSKHGEQLNTKVPTCNDEYQNAFPLAIPFQHADLGMPNSPPMRNIIAGAPLTGHNPNSDQFGIRYMGPTPIRPMPNPISPIAQRSCDVRGNARPAFVAPASEQQRLGTHHGRPNQPNFQPNYSTGGIQPMLMNSPPFYQPIQRPLNSPPFNQRPNPSMGPQTVFPTRPIQMPPSSPSFNQQPNLAMGPQTIKRPQNSPPCNQRLNPTMGPQIVGPRPIQRPLNSPPFNQQPNRAMRPQTVFSTRPIQRPPNSPPFNQQPNLGMGPQTIQRPQNSPPFNQRLNPAMGPQIVAPQPIQRPLNPPPFNQQPNHAMRPQTVAATQPIQRPRYAQLTTVSPWAVGGFVGNPPCPLVTCEALERDGVSPESCMGNEEEGFSPSVLKSLQSMKIIDDHADNDQSFRVGEQPFSSPPTVRNTADGSMFEDSAMTEDSSIISQKLDQIEKEPGSTTVMEKHSESVVSSPSTAENISPPGETISPGKKSRNRRGRSRGRGRKNGEKSQNDSHENNQMDLNTIGKVDATLEEKTEETGKERSSINAEARKLEEMPMRDHKSTDQKIQSMTNDSKTESGKINNVLDQSGTGSPLAPKAGDAHPKKRNKQKILMRVDKESQKQPEKVEKLNDTNENRSRVSKSSGHHNNARDEPNIDSNAKRKLVTNREQQPGNRNNKRQRGPRKKPPSENNGRNGGEGNSEQVKTPEKNPFPGKSSPVKRRYIGPQPRSPKQYNPGNTEVNIGDKNSTIRTENDKKAQTKSQRRNFRNRERKKQKKMEETNDNKDAKNKIEIQS